MLRFQAAPNCRRHLCMAIFLPCDSRISSNITKGNKLADEQPEMIETCGNKRINKLMMRSRLVLLVMLAMAIAAWNS